MELKTLKDVKLFQKLEQFSLDNPEASFSFSDRLSRENGWSKEFSLKVIDEYKKFVYLSAITGKSLTPSEEVDQAWHLHMIYTQSYWDDMCGNILNGKKLHHGPTKGGHAEKERYDNQYGYTLQVYKEEFGYDAPSNIWPNKEERFGNVNFRRVSVRDNFILNKNKVKSYLGGFAIVVLAIFSGFLFMSYETKNEDIVIGQAILFVLGILLGVFLIRGLWRYATRNERNYNSKKDKNNNSSGSGSSNNSSGCGSSGGCTIVSSFFGCGSSGCGSSSSSSGCGSSSSGCGSSGCGSSGCGGCGGCGS